MKNERPILTEQLNVRVPPPLRMKLENAAEADGRPVTGLVRHILETWAKQQEPRHV
jgi:predicted HicB family RNase H-like nuclease